MELFEKENLEITKCLKISRKMDAEIIKIAKKKKISQGFFIRTSVQRLLDTINHKMDYEDN